ncbi:hypothetical protein AB0L33_05350 [Streptomyces sp. NPDC052299]
MSRQQPCPSDLGCMELDRFTCNGTIFETGTGSYRLAGHPSPN